MSQIANFPFLSALLAILIAQLLKYPIAKLRRQPLVRLSIVYSTGCMPSSHSAAASALTTALVIQYGWASPYVAIAAAYGLIIMFDAMGVRRQSGEQGVAFRRLYNHIKSRAEREGDQETLDGLEEINVDNLVLTNYMGHKPLEVLFGLLLGVGIALLTWAIFALMDWPL